MSGKPDHQTDVFANSIYFKLLQEAKVKNKPLRIAFLEQYAANEELKPIITELHNAGYCVFLLGSEAIQTVTNVEGGCETSSLSADLLQENGEYISIEEYTRFMKEKSVVWRAAMMQMFAHLKKESYVSGLEDVDDLKEGKNNAKSPDFQFVLNFNKSTMGDDENYAKAQRECAQQILEFQKECGDKFNNLKGHTGSEEILRIIMDLRVGQDSNPEKGELQIFITPDRLTKDFFITFMMSETCRKLGITRNDLDHVLICPENYVNIMAGSHSIHALADPDDPAQTLPHSTFFIPRTNAFSNVLRKLQNGVEGVQQDKNGILKPIELSFIPSEEIGHYIYKPARNNPDLIKLRHKVAEEKQISNGTEKKYRYPIAEIIVADEAYQAAQNPLESIQMYLNEKYPNT